MKHNVFKLTIAPVDDEVQFTLHLDGDKGVTFTGDIMTVGPIMDTVINGMFVPDEDEKEEYVQ